MIGRKVAEWIGKTPGSKCPDHVSLRIWERCEGRCHISGDKIQRGDKWDLDHIIALCNGGENRESNLAPALRARHCEKTAADVAERAKVDRIRKRDIGLTKPSRPIPGSKASGWKKTFSGEVIRR